MDWLHPLTHHRIAKTRKKTAEPTPPPANENPSSTTARLATTDTARPVAINRFILLWSASNPLTNLPTAYANNKAELIMPICCAASAPLSIMGFLTTFSVVRHT